MGTQVQIRMEHTVFQKKVLSQIPLSGFIVLKPMFILEYKFYFLETKRKLHSCFLHKQLTVIYGEFTTYY